GGAPVGERHLAVADDATVGLAVARSDAPIEAGDTVVAARIQHGAGFDIDDEVTHVVVGMAPDGPAWLAGRRWFAAAAVSFSAALVNLLLGRRSRRRPTDGSAAELR